MNNERCLPRRGTPRPYTSRVMNRRDRRVKNRRDRPVTNRPYISPVMGRPYTHPVMRRHVPAFCHRIQVISFNNIDSWSCTLDYRPRMLTN